MGEPTGDMPMGTLTLLLADVEASTRMWAADPEAAAAAMRELDKTLDEVLPRHHGFRPLEQGEGDSFVVAFVRAMDAVTAAVDLQRVLAGTRLRIRMALHTGDLQLRDDTTYFGPAFHRAARLRELAHGGQVLLTGTTYGIVADALPGGVELVDLGLVPLRDLDRPERAYQLAAPGLERTFPPLRIRASLRADLPVQPSPLLGRAEELTEVAALLGRERMLSLVGAGGCGKTRLAVEVAWRSGSLRDKAWYVDLAPVSDPAAVVAAVAAATAARELPGGSLEDAVITHLRGASALLVLDNCEHLIPSTAALVRHVMAACPDVIVLATSREPLGVPGEAVFRVPSLRVPAPTTPLDELRDYGAVELFLARATAARRGFALTEETAPYVIQVCARLDGIPLALELAAARLHVLSVQELAARLSDRFRLLGRSGGWVLPRQQTLLASVAWSYDVLTEPQRVVLDRASVFAGWFDLDAAEHVLGGGVVEPGDVLDVLGQLVDRSLVVSDDDGFRLLETIRQYAAEALLAAGETATLRDRHLAYYRDWVLDQTYDEGEHAALVALDLRYSNIEAALSWALEQRAVDDGLSLVGRLWAYWFVRVRYAVGRAWADGFLRLPGGTAANRAAALLSAADLASTQYDEAAAVAMAVEALDLAREAGDDELLALALRLVGYRLAYVDAAAGRAQLEESAEIARRCGDRITMGRVLHELAWFAMVFESLDAAEAHAREGLELFGPEADGNLSSVFPVWALGVIATLRGELEQGATLLSRSLEVFRQYDNAYWICVTLAYQAMFALDRGDLNAARRAVDSAVAAGGELQSAVRTLDRVTHVLVLSAEGRHAEAAPFVESTRGGFAAMGPLIGHNVEAQAVVAQAEAELWTGDLESARRLATEAVALAAPTDALIFGTPALVSAALVLLGCDGLDEAEDAAHQGLALVAARGAVLYVPPALEVLALVAAARGAHERAARLLAAANAGRARIGTHRLAGTLLAERCAWLLESLSEALPATELEQAQAAGAALSLEEAVGYARRGRGGRGRPATGWGSLTPAELDVVRLVAEGLPNRSVAERLFVSPRTVSTHLTHVFDKLAVTSRAELAALAVRQGVV